jgi:hypothetical protein
VDSCRVRVPGALVTEHPPAAVTSHMCWVRGVVFFKLHRARKRLWSAWQTTPSTSEGTEHPHASCGSSWVARGTHHPTGIADSGGVGVLGVEVLK